jgi:methylaspartate mutase epsilon subunit
MHASKIGRRPSEPAPRDKPLNTGATTGYRVLLGGLGGDSHSVGLHILYWALSGNGYRVDFLGTQNTLDDFARHADGYDAVLISNLDGHAEHYLRAFAPAKRDGRPLWYLGGNLTIDEGEGYEEQFRRQGFDRVYVKFVDLATILETLACDLRGRPPSSAGGRDRLSRRPEHDFLAERQSVLAAWATGAAAADLDANARYLAGCPSFPRLLAEAERRSVLVQPRSGVPVVAEQTELLRRFRDAGAAGLSLQVDSLTRNNRYADAARAIAESVEAGRAVLNGFPVVNHGVAALRSIVEAVGVPLQTRHSTRDPRLLAEISYAGGATGFEGGPICYNIPYYKDYPLREAIDRWRYVDRLTGWYADRHGIVLDREFFGTLTATLIPPAIAITTNLAEAALAAEQGVRCVSLAYAEQGNRAQDIAAIQVMVEVTREALDELGYGGVAIHSVFHQYMAAFPSSELRSEELIFASAVSAAMAGATRIITKTPVESRQIPSLEDNLRGMELARLGIAAARDRAAPPATVAEEARLLRREVMGIWESVLECGRGDVAEGVIRGFELGLLDVPFAPSIYNRGETLTARDAHGAVRFLRTGSLHLEPEVLEFHAAKMDERRRLEGLDRERDYLLVEADVLRIPRERYGVWPLDARDADPAFLALHEERAFARGA